MEISVIIPAYNASEHILGCLESIDRGAEIIVINDGSTDLTQQVVEAYASEHDHTVIIRQDNQGVSAARNHGMRAAAKDYITMADADDRIAQNTLQRISDCAERMHADIMILRSFTKSSEKYPWRRHFTVDKTYTNSELMSAGYLRGSICGCVFKKKFIEENHLQFPEGVRLSEDSIFFAACLSHAQTICFCDIPFYFITERADSASRSYRKSDLTNFQQAFAAVDRDVPNRAIANYLKFKFAIGLTSRAVRLSLPVQETLLESGLGKQLPLALDGIRHERWKIRLLNLSYPLFYQLISLRDHLGRIR